MELLHLLCSGHCWPLVRILGVSYYSIIAWIEEEAGIVKHFSAPMNSDMSIKVPKPDGFAAAWLSRYVLSSTK